MAMGIVKLIPALYCGNAGGGDPNDFYADPAGSVHTLWGGQSSKEDS